MDRSKQEGCPEERFADGRPYPLRTASRGDVSVGKGLALVTTTFGGTSEIQKEIIARHLGL